MSEQYQVLARKYRPKNFSELLGQSHVSQALTNAIDTGRLHHAYLFTGTRGVGKTTIARILAKCLNCETGITSSPCGVCDTCQLIDQGRFLDLIEIDAASRTKVEDTRDLLENVPYAPVQGRYKVYLIDEVHMLSTHSFNALLKTLEEPPEHVKFIFATTDPQKLPITIISRCLQFVLRPMPQALLVEHLHKILLAESIVFTETAVWQLANAAKGSVRDSLSLTDQAIAFGGGQISDQTVSDMLGLVNSTDILALISAIYEDDRQTIANEINTLRAKMVDATAVFDELINSIHQMAILQVLPQTPLDMNDADAERLMALSNRINGDVLQLYYEILIKSRDGIRLASTPMQALEMAILRLLAFRPLATDEITIHSNAKPSASLMDANLKTSNVRDLNDNPTQSPNETPESASNTPIAAESLADQHQPDEAADQSDEAHLHNPNNDSNEVLVTVSTDQFLPKAPSAVHQTDIVSTSSLQCNDTDLYADSAILTEPSDDQDDNKPTDDDINHHEQLEQIDAEPSLAVMAAEHLDEAETLTETDFTEDNQDINAISAAKLAADDTNILSDDEAIDKPIIHTNTVNDGALTTQEQILERLKPTATELSGAWNAQKWDFWLHQARIDGYFSADELALMANSMMTGDIEGISQLHIAEHNSQVQSSFHSLSQKIAAHYPNLSLAPEAIVSEQLQAVPRQLFDERKQQLHIDAQNQLINSPVFQKLWQEGYVVNDGSPVLTNAKLAID